MALDFIGLQTEVFARGFDYLNDGGAGVTRVKRFINDSMHQVDEMEKWDYLYASAAGNAPLTVADLREAEAVFLTATSAPLAYQRRDILVAVYGDYTVTGTPQYWYSLTPTQIGVYPAAAATSITVKYWKFGPDLSANGDVPLMPDRFRPVIVEMAVAKALRDSNEPQAANDCLGEAARIIDTMREVLIPDTLRRRAEAAK